jgi:hypothetical protein
MAEVTREMILEYMQTKGGVVRNVDLVRHFRKYLQLNDPRAKGKQSCVYTAGVYPPCRKSKGSIKTTLGVKTRVCFQMKTSK